MDKDEEAGLRAFRIEVGSYAGAAYPERPLWVERGGVRFDIAEVVAVLQEYYDGLRQ